MNRWDFRCRVPQIPFGPRLTWSHFAQFFQNYTDYDKFWDFLKKINVYSFYLQLLSQKTHKDKCIFFHFPFHQERLPEKLTTSPESPMIAMLQLPVLENTSGGIKEILVPPRKLFISNNWINIHKIQYH